MPNNYRYIPPEQKQLVLRMYCFGDKQSRRELPERTGMSGRTVRRILSNWRKSGNVVASSQSVGRPRSISTVELAVCVHFFDSYLTNLDAVSWRLAWAHSQYVLAWNEECTEWSLWVRVLRIHHTCSTQKMRLVKKKGKSKSFICYTANWLNNP